MSTHQATNRDELFQEAKKVRDENKGETQQQRSSYNSSNFPERDPLYSTALVIQPDKEGFKQVRFLGNPIDARGDDPFSPRVIYTSLIKGDDGSKFQCIWPGFPKECPDFILSKVLNKVMRFTYSRQDQDRQYHYKDQYPELFNRVSKNDDLNNTMERGWYPKQKIIMNVIDRDEMQWHKENEKTLLLSRRASVSADGRYFYEPGIPPQIYNEVWDTIVGWAGNWENYDVVIEKLNKEPWYRVFHPIENRKQLEGFGFKPYEDMAERELTEEEKGWKRFNLDEIYRTTTDIRIENKLGVFIQEVDKKLGTRFYDELKDNADKQRKEFERIQQESEKTLESTSPTSTAVPEKSEQDKSPFPEAKPTRSRRRSKSDASFNIDDYADTYPGVRVLTEEEKSSIIGFNKEEEKFIFSPNTPGEILVCPESENEKSPCKMDSPDWFTHCPGCGIEFELEQ